MHLPVLSSRGGGGPRAYVRHLTPIAFPTLGNLTKNLGPRVGTFAFFARRNRTKSHHRMCSSVWSGYKSPERRLFLIEESTCFYSSYCVIVRVSEVLKRTVVGD